MKDCLVYIIESILGTSDVKIFSEETPDRQVILTIEPKREQVGTIIGKRGRIINAIRKLLRVRAFKEGKKILIKINTPFGNQKGVDLPSGRGEEITGSAGLS